MFFLTTDPARRLRLRKVAALVVGAAAMFAAGASICGCSGLISAAPADGHFAHGDPESAALFRWVSTGPLLGPKPDATHAPVAVKDPSIVYAGGKFHVFMTTAGAAGWGLAYASFRSWSDAATAPLTYLDRTEIGPGYRAAPQVFYFAPQRRWYLIFQGGDPLYSTTTDIDDPMSWSKPKSFFASPPAIVRSKNGAATWLDFWVICDTAKCYLFNTGDNGLLYRSETSLALFPNGFHNTAVVLQSANPAELFEASMTYRLAGADAYVTMVEAMGPKGRYFRAWVSDRLDGEWRPLADRSDRPFAGAANVSFPGPSWSEGVSHGELLRAGIDQTLEIDPCKPLQFLYQGLAPGSDASNYMMLPYRLGLLTAQGPNPISAFCRRR